MKLFNVPVERVESYVRILRANGEVQNRRHNGIEDRKREDVVEVESQDCPFTGRGNREEKLRVLKTYRASYNRLPV